jgi:hypothetical protein
MRQLIFNESETSLFFTPHSSIEEIITWLESSILSDKIEGLRINELHSCSVHKISDMEILISGDEDLIEVEVRTITPIF